MGLAIRTCLVYFCSVSLKLQAKMFFTSDAMETLGTSIVQIEGGGGEASNL